jgi:hypothetical protein
MGFVAEAAGRQQSALEPRAEARSDRGVAAGRDNRVRSGTRLSRSRSRARSFLEAEIFRL